MNYTTERDIADLPSHRGLIKFHELSCELLEKFANHSTDYLANLTNITGCPGVYGGEALSPHVVDHLEDYPDMLQNTTVRYALIAAHIIGTILAAAGNFTVLLVIARRKSLRQSPAVLFIFNLAFCDLMQCLVYRPVLVADFFLPFTDHPVYPHHYTVCQIVTYFQALVMAVSFHTIVAISQERLCLIVFPLKAKRMFSTSRTKKLVLIIWLVGAIWVLPFPLRFLKFLVVDVQVDGGERATQIAYCGVFVTDVSGVVFLTLIVVFYFALPLLILAVSYTKIFIALYRPAKTLARTQEQGLYRKLLKTRRKLAKMMMAVTVLFALCWGPHFAFFYHMALGRPLPSNAILIATVIEVLPLFSAMFNPFIYTLNSRTFRDGFRAMFRSQKSKRLSGESAYRTFNSPSNVYRRRASGATISKRPLRRSSTYPNGQLVQIHMELEMETKKPESL